MTANIVRIERWDSLGDDEVAVLKIDDLEDELFRGDGKAFYYWNETARTSEPLLLVVGRSVWDSAEFRSLQ